MSSYKYYDLIRRPVITEKTNLLSEHNKYTFYVDKLAEKLVVKVSSIKKNEKRKKIITKLT